MTTARFTAKQLSPQEIERLVSTAVKELRVLTGLRSIVLFGSAATGQMDEGSDIDIALIFDSPENAKIAQKTAHSLRKEATWPMDLLCVDVDTFRKKSAVGGVYFVIRREGKVILGEPMP